MIPTTAITSSIAGSVVVSLVQNRINKHPQAINGAFKFFMDTITFESTISLFQKSEDCFACRSNDPIAIRVVGKRFCGKDTMVPLIGKTEGEIILSEEVLICGVCKLCGKQKEYYESARKLDDTATICESCGVQSISTEFVHRLNVEDFSRIFAGRNIPCKFLIFNSKECKVIVEMEE